MFNTEYIFRQINFHKTHHPKNMGKRKSGGRKMEGIFVLCMASMVCPDATLSKRNNQRMTLWKVTQDLCNKLYPSQSLPWSKTHKKPIANYVTTKKCSSKSLVTTPTDTVERMPNSM